MKQLVLNIFLVIFIALGSVYISQPAVANIDPEDCTSCSDCFSSDCDTKNARYECGKIANSSGGMTTCYKPNF